MMRKMLMVLAAATVSFSCGGAGEGSSPDWSWGTYEIDESLSVDADDETYDLNLPFSDRRQYRVEFSDVVRIQRFKSGCDGTPFLLAFGDSWEVGDLSDITEDTCIRVDASDQADGEWSADVYVSQPEDNDADPWMWTDFGDESTFSAPFREDDRVFHRVNLRFDSAYDGRKQYRVDSTKFGEIRRYDRLDCEGSVQRTFRGDGYELADESGDLDGVCLEIEPDLSPTDAGVDDFQVSVTSSEPYEVDP